MHEAALAHAALPPPAKILGVGLRPYSLAHELFLTRESNPIISNPKAAKVSDLREAVLICAGTFADGLKLGEDRWMRFKLPIWRFVTRKLNFARELAGFLEYRASGMICFKPSEMLRPGIATARSAGAPMLLRLHQFLAVHLHLTQEQAWDYPFGLAVMQWQAFMESDDRIWLYNDEEAEHDRFVAEQEAKCQA